jgi:hypothetical protein
MDLSILQPWVRIWCNGWDIEGLRRIPIKFSSQIPLENCTFVA